MYIEYMMMSVNIVRSYDDYTPEDIEVTLMRLEDIDEYAEDVEDFMARELAVLALDLHHNPLRVR